MSTDAAEIPAHRYTAEDWGFDVQSLRETLAPYIEAFGVELEELGP